MITIIERYTLFPIFSEKRFLENPWNYSHIYFSNTTYNFSGRCGCMFNDLWRKRSLRELVSCECSRLFSIFVGLMMHSRYRMLPSRLCGRGAERRLNLGVTPPPPSPQIPFVFAAGFLQSNRTTIYFELCSIKIRQNQKNRQCIRLIITVFKAKNRWIMY